MRPFPSALPAFTDRIPSFPCKPQPPAMDSSDQDSDDWVVLDSCTDDDLVPAPMEVTQWPHWELGEMEGSLCATCMDDAVVVICLDLARRIATGQVAWTLAGHFEGGCLRGRQDVTLLRSQGKAEVVMWDPRAEAVVAMDLEGRTTRTISLPSGTGYYADFIPYIATLAAVSASSSNVPHKECRRTTGTNEMGAECRAMAVDAEAY